ncbi:hypothetical protein P171DRAFT_20635 [Karstenula rhodostoma CBS 690.94]|uniref:Uncharacterized protein n=1 Tax=Karstenula rhodostoma CBS 690.94 TaxID=1392251 RepID=A0A9P4UJY4_9PLEO|nr:hypothetical protein P171DRAFT_20635 [Karstenula rhodostoma CBS 690.94]
MPARDATAPALNKKEQTVDKSTDSQPRVESESQTDRQISDLALPGHAINKNKGKSEEKQRDRERRKGKKKKKKKDDPKSSMVLRRGLVSSERATKLRIANAPRSMHVFPICDVCIPIVTPKRSKGARVAKEKWWCVGV